MNLFTLLFSFRGRINRAKYWLAVLIYLISLSILWAIVYWYELEGGALIAVAVFALPIWVSGIAVGIKRLHDRDKSGWWILLFYFGPQVLNGLATAAGENEQILSLLLSTASVALGIWAIVELGCLRGTPGPNRFGPDPLAKATA
ncbi:MAG: DUF805 domain-containing protein [Pseudomonadota bacterium]|nr:DUF805 domain-containing protein [Pseudomonadota bacterium]